MKARIFLLCLAITAYRAEAQDSPNNSGCVTNPPNYGSLSYADADKATDSEANLIVSEKVKKICPEYITNLVKQLRYGHLTTDNKVLAIYLLGELQPSDTDAIEVLIELIDLKATKSEPPGRPPRWPEYPAEGALMTIGMPAANPILNHLPTETKNLRRHLLCEALKHIEGKEPAEDHIKQQLSTETDPKRRANLEAALKELKK